MSASRMERSNAARAQVRALRAEGLTFREIGRMLGLSREQVRQRAKQPDEVMAPPLPEPRCAADLDPVSELEVCTRTADALRNAGVVDVQQLRLATDAQLRAIPGLGRKSVTEIRVVLDEDLTPSERRRAALQ